MTHPLSIALTKGRLLKKTLELFKAAGIQPLEDASDTRKLRVDTTRENTSVLLVRASDVPAYVEYGGADIGVTGKDTLLEHHGRGLYEPLDLEIGQCQLVVAAKKDMSIDTTRQLRVATKYPQLTRQHFDNRGQQVEVIKLYGSMELAPLVGMADVIVDIVETGETLKANDLVVVEEICKISTRLIVNKASMKMKHAAIQSVIDGVSGAVGRV